MDQRTKEVTTLPPSPQTRSSAPVERIELVDVVADLAENKRAKLEFIGGGAERRLLQEFGGMGAVLRW